jgi:20S proteasome alpha/beta subunit
MTLILAIPAADGIVMASDAQITTGEVRTPGRKIHRLNEKAVWAAAGELALIQRVEERLGTLPADLPLANLRDQIGLLVKQSVTELVQLDFRTQFLPPDPDRLLQLHFADFVFAEFPGKPEILHITAHAAPEWIQGRPFVAGNGDLFAYALLKKYEGQSLSLARASILAYKVMEETIEVGAYGLGPPIDVWQITAEGVKNLSKEETAHLAETAHSLREMEIQLLILGKEAFKKSLTEA